MSTFRPDESAQHDLRDLKDFYMAGTEEVEVEGTAIDAAPDKYKKDADGNPWLQSERRYTKEVAGEQIQITRGGHITGPEEAREWAQSYETIALPSSLSVEVPEAGSVSLDHVRVGHSADQQGESRWGDGQFADIAYERPEFSVTDDGASAVAGSETYTASTQEHGAWVFTLPEGRTVYWNAQTDHAWEVRSYPGGAGSVELRIPQTLPPAFDTEKRQLATDAVAERPLQDVVLTVQRVELNLDSSAPAPRGRVKFEVRPGGTNAEA